MVMALQSLWTDRCTIDVATTETASGTHITAQVWQMIAKDLPCRISFETIAAAGMADPAAGITQSIKLFLSSTQPVPPGSRVTVTRPGQKAVRYRSSGQPAVYSQHQEVRLELMARWA